MAVTGRPFEGWGSVCRVVSAASSRTAGGSADAAARPWPIPANTPQADPDVGRAASHGRRAREPPARPPRLPPGPRTTASRPRPDAGAQPRRTPRTLSHPHRPSSGSSRPYVGHARECLHVTHHFRDRSAPCNCSVFEPMSDTMTGPFQRLVVVWAGRQLVCQGPPRLASRERCQRQGGEPRVSPIRADPYRRSLARHEELRRAGPNSPTSDDGTGT